MSHKTKILFTHNTAMWYRLPFFKKVSEIYDLDLVFTHINVIKDIYDNNINNEIEGLEGVNYTILPNTHGFCKGLFKKARGNYDVVVGGSWDTAQELIETIMLHLMTRIKNKPFIIWREDWDWKRENTFKEKILNRVIKYITTHSDAILVPGTLHKEYFTKLGVLPDNIHIMPNVSNISGYDENIKRSHDNKKILYVGRLIPRKGVDYLIKAYSKLKRQINNIELIIIGSGPEEDTLKEYVRDNNIDNVTFTGKIDNNKLKSYYQQSNLVIIPSINEGMGDPWVFVLNEAMYYGNPVIATTAVGAAPDMIKDNGFIVPERNSDELYSAMYQIISDDTTEEIMGKNSRIIIENKFQYSNMVNAFTETIESVINK